MPPRSSTWPGSSGRGSPSRRRRRRRRLLEFPVASFQSSVMNRFLFLSAVLLASFACSKSEPPQPAAATAAKAAAPVAITKMPKFDAAPILDRIKTLSSDEFEGRRPGTKGEDLTVKYLEEAFR